MGKKIFVLGVARLVTGYDEHTGDIKVQMARGTQKYNPLMFPVVVEES